MHAYTHTYIKWSPKIFIFGNVRPNILIIIPINYPALSWPKSSLFTPNQLNNTHLNIRHDLYKISILGEGQIHLNLVANWIVLLWNCLVSPSYSSDDPVPLCVHVPVTEPPTHAPCCLCSDFLLLWNLTLFKDFHNPFRGLHSFPTLQRLASPGTFTPTVWGKWLFCFCWKFGTLERV
jgi:hypothetical protein